jgi:hypothetical protein
VTVTTVPTGPQVGEKPLITGTGMTVKEPDEVAGPAGLVTMIGPVLAPVGTVAVSSVSEWTVKLLAGTSPNCTAVTLVNPLPVTVTTVPTGPEVGVKPLIAGAKMIVKWVGEIAVPAGLVTVISPVVALGGTVAVSCVSELTVKLVAGKPLNWTAVAPVNPLPVTVTTVPNGPEAGVKLLITGTTITVKAPVELAVSAGLVTVIGPVLAPEGTVAVSRVSELMV